jgi:uncharacterized membrane protein
LLGWCVFAAVPLPGSLAFSECSAKAARLLFRTSVPQLQEFNHEWFHRDSSWAGQ